jgi:16S rRNA (uracil1498-N3)-methyltransferase
VSIQRFLVDSVDGDEVAFSPEQAHQLRSVLRLRPGDRVRAFDGVADRDVLVELVTHSSGRVLQRCPQRPEARTRLVAYPALLRREKFETVLQKLTELGVHAIVPMLTARCVVRAERRLERWQAIVREATEQCGRGRVPMIRRLLQFDDAIREAQAHGVALMAYEEERQSDVRQALADRPNAVSLLVGPEGGFSGEEAQQAQAAGVRLVTLGPRILRAETAAPVLAALVLYELGDLSSWAVV